MTKTGSLSKGIFDRFVFVCLTSDSPNMNWCKVVLRSSRRSLVLLVRSYDDTDVILAFSALYHSLPNSHSSPLLNLCTRFAMLYRKLFESSKSSEEPDKRMKNDHRAIGHSSLLLCLSWDVLSETLKNF